MLVKIFASYDLKSVTVNELVGIKKCTLTTVFLRTERGGCEIYYFLKCLSLSQETLAELHYVNPIEITPSRINFFCTFESKIEVEAINIECYPFFSFHNK